LIEPPASVYPEVGRSRF